jgi:hypothetical protein
VETQPRTSTRDMTCVPTELSSGRMLNPKLGWCAREDSNLHPLRDQILSLARLPFRHARFGRSTACVPLDPPVLTLQHCHLVKPEVTGRKSVRGRHSYTKARDNRKQPIRGRWRLAHPRVDGAH